jgi:inosose dehydratase
MMRIGCQTYSWQMSLPLYQGRIDHICEVVGRAGFAGLEPEVIMLGQFAGAEHLRGALEANNLELAALTLVEDWGGEHETPQERASADAAIALAASFDGALLALCQMPGRDRHDLAERQRRVLSCVRDVARRAEAAGLRTTFHPNSPEGSLFRTAEDYEVLLDGLPASVGFTPDLGHVARGGMDPLAVVKQYRERVNHVHAKDMDGDGRWAMIGTGVVPVAEVAQLLQRTGYEGWFVLEDESELAERDPDGVAAQLGRYVDKVLRPLYEEAQYEEARCAHGRYDGEHFEKEEHYEKGGPNG